MADKAPPLVVAILANSGFDATLGLGTQTLDDKYLMAVLEGCHAVPIIVSTLLDPPQIETIMTLVDGVVLTGDVSNIEPDHYGTAGTVESHGPFDKNRDRTAFHLVNAAQKQHKPVLGICRGLQEINVAFGGTLRTGFIGEDAFPHHASIEKRPDPDLIYQNSHPVSVDLQTGLGAAIGKTRVQVNSVHVQAIAKLGSGLVPVAVSDDGILEAFEDATNRRVMAVQWHPEYRSNDSQVSQAIFGHFARIMQQNRSAAR